MPAFRAATEAASSDSLLSRLILALPRTQWLRPQPMAPEKTRVQDTCPIYLCVRWMLSL